MAAARISMNLTFGTFCSGIGSPEVAWKRLGWRPLFCAEIEPFPSAVLSHHHPETPNLGDITRIDRETIRQLRPDVVCAGTPCQSFSVAGLRKGLDDPRGNLALVFLGLVDAARPRWVVWENVAGVLSSTSGEPACPPPDRVGVAPDEQVVGEVVEFDETGDFACFTAALGELGYGWAYRVLDAQYGGVPQRRRRVFVVGCLGDWRRAAAVLFERESLCGHPAPSREAGARVAASPTRGADSSGAGGYAGRRREDDFNIVGTLNANGKAAGSATQQDVESGMLVAHSLRADGFDASEDGTGRGTLIVPVAIQEDNQNGVTMRDTAGSLRSDGMAVRRLTPLECERLMGFPDGHTAIQFRGKPAADGPRYRALGNSMVVNELEWIGRRIEAVEGIAA